MKYCCPHLKNETEENEGNRKKCIKYLAKFRMFAIVVDEAEEVYQPIDYCPFCGKKLPKDLNDEYWKTIIEEIDTEYYPTHENYDKNRPLPEEFKTDEWWKKRGL
jgi:hypothetical protein